MSQLRSYAGAAAQAPGKPLQARGPFWRDGPWKDRDDPRDRHRPMGELVQPHPPPPDQRRRPLTRRRRTPLPSQPHHHRRPARHGITNPPTKPKTIHTDYRRPLHTFEQTITAALSLHVFKTTL